MQGDKGGVDEEKHALNPNIETEKQEVQNVDKEESTEKMLDDESGKVWETFNGDIHIIGTWKNKSK